MKLSNSQDGFAFGPNRPKYMMAGGVSQMYTDYNKASNRKSTNDAWLAGRIAERVVLEKPFGKDHDTCQQLMGEIGALVSPLS